jgi:hypothetical protein
VVAPVARLTRHDRGDQLERRQHGPARPRVRPRLALEPAAGPAGRADPEDAELVVLGRAVVRDNAEVGQDRAAAARQLGALRLGPGLGLVAASPSEGQQPAAE